MQYKKTSKKYFLFKIHYCLLHPSWVIICSGDIFVDDVGKALGELDFSLYTLDVKKLSLEEMETTIRRFDPQVVFAINYTNGLAELCHSNDLDFICWEVRLRRRKSELTTLPG